MITIKNLVKKFGDHIITNGLDLTVKKGTFLAIIGRSGEGKSVLIKQIIGLIRPTSGNITIDGEEITTLSDNDLQKKVFSKCGYVFQFAALLDSLSVFENIGITLLENGENPEIVRKLVIEKLRDVGLKETILDKYPNELSGGMRKRVGLARTLMMNPQILLYDEPTTGLDPITVRRIHELMADTHKKHHATSIVISHDPSVFDYVDEVAFLYEGKIMYTGLAKEIWDCDNPYVHQFIRGELEGPVKTS